MRDGSKDKRSLVFRGSQDFVLFFIRQKGTKPKLEKSLFTRMLLSKYFSRTLEI